MTSEKRVGCYSSSYGFIRAYHFGETGSDHIGSVSDHVSAEELKAFHEYMCELILSRTGKPTHEFFGGYYQH
jgi:hypothetical protein